MKKIAALLLLAATLLAVCCLQSCAGMGIKEPLETRSESLEKTNESAKNIPRIQEFNKGWRYETYGNYFFFLDSGKLKYQNLNDPQKEPTPVYLDPLAGSDDNPFSSLGAISFVAVDTAASAGNGGVPILIMGGEYFESVTTSSGHREIFEARIGSYNMATGDFKLLKKGIQGEFMSLGVYQNRILYCVADDEQGWNLYSIRSADGKDEKTMANPDRLFYRLLYAAGDRIYYRREDQEVLCSCDMNFENAQTLFPIELVPEMFVCDHKIYYAANKRNNDSERYTCYDICCRDLSDLTHEKILLSGVTIGMNWENLFFYYSAENVFTFENNHDSLGGKILYCIDVNSGKTDIIYEKEENKHSNCYIALGEKYAVCMATNVATGETTVTCIDLATKKETVLPGNI